MNITIASFATTIEDIGFPDTELRQIRLHQTAHKFIRCTHRMWKRKDILKTSFGIKNKSILSEKKGAGFWLWKPYIILEELKNLKDNDVLIYCDNSYFFVDNPEKLIKYIDPNTGTGFFCDNRYTLKEIIHDDAFNFLKIEELNLSDYPVVIAGIIALKKNEFVVTLMEKWLALCLNKMLLMDSSIPNIHNTNYKFHKHDMTLLTYLAALEKISGNAPPTLIGIDYYTDSEKKFPPILVWDKDGIGCRRPRVHFFKINYLLFYLRRKIGTIQ